MEIEAVPAQESLPIVKQKALIQQPLFIITLLLAIVSVAGVGFLYQKNGDLKKQSDAQLASLDDLSKKIEAYRADSSKLSNLQEKSDALSKVAFLVSEQHDIEGAVVTDDFTVDKVYLGVQDSGELNITIDINTQPQMALHYTGQGAFDLSDRELRAKSLAIINEVKDRYTSNATDQMPKWDDSSVYLTIKNYAIGDSTSGEFKLVGEK
ncbi:hypothetical protein [Cohnella sp. AR92]|uniref:hypothetical protein n=1 Tax=Cohnella sp. AR92 TaxID=648716 RepID=UPI000F8EC202|nr:hypothetical protein [Cohnella sp. AR92]RUS48384.1 hypothetical protein ELR57_02895 [Cohnella sp. AR92]